MNYAPTGKQRFFDQLRAGLKGLPRTFIEETLADYEAHFEAGLTAGRSESDIAAALGDPRRLARELRAEAGVRRWEDERSLSSALGAVAGIIGLAAIDFLIVLPLLVSFCSAILTLIFVGVVLFLVGSILLPFALIGLLPFAETSWLQDVLVSIGLASGGASLTAMCVLLVIGTVNLLIRYGRAHYRLISPHISASNPL